MQHSVQSSQSRAQHTFAQSPQANIPRASFDRSHTHKTTFDEGYLVPVFCDEVLPGDTFNLKMTALARIATLIYPLMDNLYLESFFFFVPNRLVWEHWENFNGAQPLTTSDSTDYVIPQVVAPAMGGVATGDLADYFGIPIKVNSLSFNSLPLRCYNLIYNEWFRDENLQNAVTVEIDDGPDTYSNYTLLRRGKRHDYFTSCLPWPQKINDGTIVTVPLGTTAPIKRTDSAANAVKLMLPGTNSNATYGGPTDTLYTVNHSSSFTGMTSPANSAYAGLNIDPNGSLYTDLTDASGATINALRQAFQLQKLYERDARGGTRYTEIIRAHFNVISPDMRLQRPEYLGGGSQMISINTSVQSSGTSITGEATPQGNLAGWGTASVHGHGFTKSFTEHGYIIGLVATRADLNYQQGLNRMWSRSIRWDFYWPALSHIGEQAVLNGEIYAVGSSQDEGVFGYQERYAEYRYKPGQITGLFRSTATGPLDAWHLAQKFTSLPTLGATFIVENAPMSRVEAVSNQQDFIFDAFFDMKCARPMPLFGVPGLIDHF